MPIFELCLSDNPKYVSCIRTLLQADFKSLLLILGLGAHMGSSLETVLCVGGSLSLLIIYSQTLG